MFIEERHKAILEIIKENGRILINEIQEKFNVSPDSARRDLRLLEGRGLVKRTHGGAIMLQQVNLGHSMYRDISKDGDLPNYVAIAKKAAQLIKENDVAYITSGSIGFVLLKYLPRDISYTLFVNSIAMANELKHWDNVTVYIPGGRVMHNTEAALSDSYAAAFARNMHFDMCFMSGAGYDAVYGFTNGKDETDFQLTVIENSRKKILLLPNHKIGFKGFIKVCDGDRFDTIITDWDTPEDEIAKISEIGIEVIIANDLEG
ncbi:MAG: DeoR/GlpR family DNA-binding transcription regulator [Defluviitaleaceae bacterium]|nr:DeoR/GlpR family DNA-binding transcription regulator [Defluviitaleaceae bacterium]